MEKSCFYAVSTGRMKKKKRIFPPPLKGFKSVFLGMRNGERTRKWSVGAWSKREGPSKCWSVGIDKGIARNEKRKNESVSVMMVVSWQQVKYK